MSDVSYKQLQEALESVSAPVGAAECHGILVGMLCAAGQVDRSRWVAEIHAPEKPDSEAGRTYIDRMASVYGQTISQIDDEAVSLEIMLPGDDQPLQQRADALGQWCQGFMYGYGLGGGKAPRTLSDNAADVMGDIEEFSRVEMDTTESEEDEEAFVEIVEYVRVGVLLIRDELHPPSPQGPVQLH